MVIKNILLSRNKHGWLRIFEAAVAIMLLTSVMLVLYNKQVQKQDVSDYVYQLQSRILGEISLRDDLRDAVFSNNLELLTNFSRSVLPQNFDFEIKICDLETEVGCRTTKYIEKDVYSDDVVLSGNLEVYSPKKVRLFVWEK